MDKGTTQSTTINQAIFVSSTHSDLDKIAKCHRAAFPESFSSKLGPKYVIQMLSWYLDSGSSFLFHLENQNEVVGYCGSIVTDGTLSTGAASGMTQHSFGTAVKALILKPWLLFHPEIKKRYKFIWRNIKTKLGLYKPKRTKEDIKKIQQEPFVGLVVIGANPKYQGKGYGSKILQEFEIRAKKYNVTKLQLTVKRTNEKAIKAYTRNGWQRGKTSGDSLSMFKKL